MVISPAIEMRFAPMASANNVHQDSGLTRSPTRRGRAGKCLPGAYNVDMRTLIVGDRNWSCLRLAEKIIARLFDRYGRDLLIIHGGEAGVDQAVTMACQSAWSSTRGGD